MTLFENIKPQYGLNLLEAYFEPFFYASNAYGSNRFNVNSVEDRMLDARPKLVFEPDASTFGLWDLISFAWKAKSRMLKAYLSSNV